MFDGQQLGETIVAQVKGFLDRAVAPLKAENAELKARLKALEDRPAPEMPALPSLEAAWSEYRPQAEEIIAEAVSRAVEALPKPKDGEPGKDAANIVEAVKHEGELVLTLQDGRLIRTGIRDGKDGDPGAPGFSLDDFDIEPGDDGRTYTLKFERGEAVHKFELTFPCPVYCGVWKEGESYVPGDIVSFGGSGWHCNREDPGKPETKDCGWQLMVKRGRDGKGVKNG